MATLQLDLPLLLPDVSDNGDGCISRLETLLLDKMGIEQAHLVPPNGGPARLCLHYDPDVVPLAQVERYAQVAGVQITDRYGHAILPLRAIDSEDAGQDIEANLRGLNGVLAASVSLPAQLARVEFDRQRVSPAAIAAALTRWGYVSAERVPTSAQATPPQVAALETSPRGIEHAGSWYASNKE